MIKRKNIISILFPLWFIIILFFFLNVLSAKEKRNSMGKATVAEQSDEKVTRTLSNVANMSYWIFHDGTSAHDPYTDDAGIIYPRGTVGVVFQDGFVYGGYVNDPDTSKPSLRVGGQTYVIGTTPGWVVNGVAVSANDSRAAIYRINRKYIKPYDEMTAAAQTAALADLRQDAAELNGIGIESVTDDQVIEVIDQYAYDWENWPSDLGAPVYADGTPGLADADQVIWFVVNDFNEANAISLYGSPSMGMELQTTIWAYNQPNSTLGQICFKRYRLINKGGFRVDSMYVCQWSDPDVGNYSDDLGGCDISRSLGFAYSGNRLDDQFSDAGIPPAAVGYDFFQGPVVDGVAGQDLNENGVDDAADYAIFDLKSVGPGKINLPMTSFGYFAAGSAIDDPELGEYDDGTLPWYNLLRGYLPTNDIADPSSYTHGAGVSVGEATKFPLDGDPFRRLGDVDGTGENLPPGDRRILLPSGPFTLMPGDTQEVVIAVVAGIITETGGDNRNAVEQMKLNDDFAQFIYNNLFEGIPKPPVAPVVTVGEFEDNVVLNWGKDFDAIAESEKDDPILGFNFEGYNIYQLPSATAAKSQAKLVATFDKINGIQLIRGKKFLPDFGDIVEVPIQRGTDSGIQRYFIVDKDYINDRPLYTGNTYYFAVTGYNYNSDPTVPEPSLESSLLPAIVVVPQSSRPGTKYGTNPGEAVEISHSSGLSDGFLEITAVSPADITGHTYQVVFEQDEDTNSVTYGELLWHLIDSTATDTILKNQLQLLPDDPGKDSPIVEGFQIKVYGPPYEIKSITEVAWEGTTLDEPDNVWHSLNSTTDYYIGGADGSWDIDRLERWVQYAIPRDFELRFTEAGGFGVFAFDDDQVATTPFEIWDIGINTPDDPSDDRRMIPFLTNFDGITASSWGYNTGTDQYYGYPCSDWIYWMDAEGADGYDNFASVCATTGAGGTYPYDSDGSTDGYWADFHGGFVYPIGRFIVCDFAEDGTPPPSGTTVRVITNKPNTLNDMFVFTPGQNLSSLELALNEVKKVNVFPNPYYGDIPGEGNRFDRFVTFTHLPRKVKIRIFNLAGVLVRTLTEQDKLAEQSQFLRWDLKNESELPVASGIYIAHIDMPDLKKTKVLKVFIIQSAQVLKYY